MPGGRGVGEGGGSSEAEVTGYAGAEDGAGARSAAAIGLFRRVGATWIPGEGVRARPLPSLRRCSWGWTFLSPGLSPGLNP